jgi:hypothetical protein|tara:strand:+ start:10815 stop:11279 length:465 start_codon:yes stop_codon:yes gene_type:complete
MFKITKEEFIGRFFQIFLVLISVVVAFFGGLEFFIISFIFLASGGFFEFIIMNNFYSKPKIKITKKDKNDIKIKNAFLWVHKNVEFIKKYNTTIYDFNKIGFLVSTFSYLIMFIYVVIAFLLFRQFSYYGFLIYLIPIILNAYSFFRNRYFIFI